MYEEYDGVYDNDPDYYNEYADFPEKDDISS